MEQIISEYLFLVYLVPIVSILWAANDLKSFIVVVQAGSILFLMYGATEAFEAIDKASRYISDDDKMKLFWVSLSPFFVISSVAFLNMVCLNSVLEVAIEYRKSKTTG